MTPTDALEHRSIALSLSTLLLVATAAACGGTDSTEADGKTPSAPTNG